MRISSDTTAKMGAVAAVIIVAAACGIMGAIALMNFSGSETTYQVTFDVETMDVYEKSGHVYNVCMSTEFGDRYYNPETRDFPPFQVSPSNKAVLYMSVTMGSSTNYSDDVIRTVQTDPVHSSETISGSTLGFKVRTSSSSQIASVFLLLKGSDNDPSNGTVIDIYDKAPGESGIRIDIDMKDHSKQFTLQGNADSEIIGLLKFTVTVKAV